MSRPHAPEPSRSPAGRVSTRCAAGENCPAGTNIHDEAGERVGRHGAFTEHGDLCERCRDNTAYAVASLPRDLRDLSKLLVPSTSQKLRSPDVPAAPRVKKAPPLPLRGDVLSLMELIIYETTTWANAVARAAGMDAPTTLDLDDDGNRIDPRTGEWLPINLERSRWDARLTQCCDLITHRFDQFLTLPALEYQAHSLSADAEAGHDPDTTTRLGDEFWCNRTGAQAGLILLDLHRQAERHLGLHPGERLKTPCPRCQRRALVREHQNNRVVCRDCTLVHTDDEHERIAERAVAVANGLPDPNPDPVRVVGRALVPVELTDLRDRFAAEAAAAAARALAGAGAE